MQKKITSGALAHTSVAPNRSGCITSALRIKFLKGARVIARYTRPAMGRIWTEENKYSKWLQVELAATATLADAGMVPRQAAEAIRDKATFDVARIQQIEAEVRHD